MFTKKDISDLVSNFGVPSTITTIAKLLETGSSVSIDDKECTSKEEITERLAELGYE